MLISFYYKNGFQDFRKMSSDSRARKYNVTLFFVLGGARLVFVLTGARTGVSECVLVKLLREGVQRVID